MRPYRIRERSLMKETFTFRTKLFIKQICTDIANVWLLDLPFPTFFKLVAIFWLGLMMVFSLATPIFLVAASLLPTITLLQSHFCTPDKKTLLCAVQLPQAGRFWRSSLADWSQARPTVVREFLTRWVLVCNSMATSLDYLHIMQQLVEDMLP